MVTVLLLTVTGFAQMPLFTRYYMTSVPGFSWLGNFGLTHSLHYIVAAVFLAQVCYWVGNTVFARGWVLTPTGRWRVLAVVLLVVTGLVRMAKNDSGLWFSPSVVMAVDWTHLAATMAFGGLALIARRLSQPYLAKKQ
ncbi:uncharacterized protein DFE_0126 [Desulfovibrio ferrophilus]|uniref:Iron-sulfur cluster-binding protein n=2 Tax=Desulfovibrio ferrophilus TaxID=241368 RepID=A0A2Z6AUE0_9BACT|nr:uncharacterized protein DFE_0126 [Desulfovibrio ferrophilus]